MHSPDVFCCVFQKSSSLSAESDVKHYIHLIAPKSYSSLVPRYFRYRFIDIDFRYTNLHDTPGMSSLSFIIFLLHIDDSISDEI